MAGPLTVDDQGNAIYNVLALNPADPWGRQGSDIAGAWLVKVTPQGVSAAASYQTLIPDAPTQCRRRRPARTPYLRPYPAKPPDHGVSGWDRLYNSAVVFRRGSVAGLHRKLSPAIHRSVYEAGCPALLAARANWGPTSHPGWNREVRHGHAASRDLYMK